MRTARSLLVGVGCVALLTLVPLASGSSAARLPGSLDRSFGSGGLVTAGPYQGGLPADALALQRDGKILLATPRGIDRMSTNGAFDPSFGTGGHARVDFGVTAIAVQPDGRIVIAGEGASGLELARYSSAGSLDPTFGQDGTEATALPFSTEVMKLQPDGKILVAGTALYPDYSSDFALARFDPDGHVDSGFGTNGSVTTDIAYRDVASALALQPDGKIVVAGGGSGRESEAALEMVRYSPNGSVDTTFGTGGVVRRAFGSNSSAAAVTLQPDGKILVAGTFIDAIAVARFKANGILDRSFADHGVAWPLSISADATLMAQQHDGKLVVAGWTYNGDKDNLVLVRLTREGSRDRSFGNSGLRTTGIRNWSIYPRGIAIQGDGKILVAGGLYSPYVDTNPPPHLLVARYVGGNACLVPRLRGKLLKQAERAIRAAHCSVGTITRIAASEGRSGRVISQRPRPGKRLRAGSNVRLVVSLGPGRR